MSSTTYGITDQGFVLKRLANILDDFDTALSLVTDPVSGETLTPDLSDENDPLVQIVNAFADGLSVCWEQLQQVYNQFDPNKATGAALSGLVPLNGITRQAGTYSTVQLTLTGTAGVSIAAGQQVSPLDDSSVWNLPAFTFDSGGNATVTATCSEIGAISADSTTLVKILTPQSGWLTVTNLVAAVEGSAEETDTDLRARRANSTSGTASAIVESIYSSLLAVSGVSFVYSYHNITDSTDAHGVPSKNLAVVVQGGADADIANVLWLKASAFIQYGTTTVNKVDAQGITYPMKFTRAASVPIYIAVTVQVVDSSKFPSDGDAVIIASIIDYTTSGETALGELSGVVKKTFGIGTDVYSSDFYVAVLSVPGIIITSVFVGETDSPTDTSVMIDWNEIASFSAAHISVTVT